MRAPLRAVLCIVLLASVVADARAQSRRAPGKPARARQRVTPDAATSLAESRRQYAALLQLRDSARRYFATLTQGTADHAAAASSLSDIEARVAALEKRLLAMLASPNEDVGADLPPASQPPAADAAAETPAEPAAPAAGVLTTTAENPAGTDTAAVTPPQDTGGATGTGGAQEDAAATPTPEPTPMPEGIVVWLNRRVEEKAIALINQGSNANQTEAPAGSGGSTSLVDQSSASDLIGAAFNLARLSAGTDDDEEVGTSAVTASAYSLLAVFKGADPLDPAFYNRHKNWRKFSFTLGFEDEKKEGDEGTTDRATLAGFKWLIKNGRDAGSEENRREHTGKITAALREAAVAFAHIDEEIKGFLFRSERLRKSELFRTAFTEFLAARESSLRENIDAARETIRTLEGRPQRQLEEHELETVAQIRAEMRAGTASNTRIRLLRRLQPLETARLQLAVFQAELKEVADLRAKSDDQIFTFDQQTGAQNAWTKAEIAFARIDFTSKLLNNPDKFTSVLAELSADEQEALDKFIDARITPFVRLKGETRRALEEIRARPQFSFAFLSKRRRMGDDEYTSDLIYEKGLGTRIFSTLNAGFKYKDSKLVGGDSRGGKVAGQLQLQLTREDSLVDKSPIYLSFAADAEWLSGVKPKYRAQAKIKFPVTDGIDIPFSFTVANRTELIDETDVRGQFGFTFDAAKLFRAFRFKLPPLAGAALDFLPLVLPQTPGQ